MKQVDGKSSPASLLPLVVPSRRPVNLRSLSAGLLGVIFISGLTPYNDLVLGNTFLIGNFLPVGLLLFMLMVVVLINAPLHWLAPRQAFSSGELAVVLAMVLVSCGVPSSGVMRYLTGQIVSPWYHSGSNPEYARVVQNMQLPDWIFPKVSDTSTTIFDRANDPVVRDFFFTAPRSEDTFAARWRAVPWRAWLRPAVTWGILVGAVLVALTCAAIIVRRQWVENERLAFPLADVYLALIEQPKPGHTFNSLFRSRGFWIAFAVVFYIHGSMALHQYVKPWPVIPLTYDFRNILTDGIWVNVQPFFKSNTVFFCVVGITYYLSTTVALSLWLSFVLLQVALIIMGGFQVDFTAPMQDDQRMGMLLPFVITIVWIGRHHWALVVKQMFRRPLTGEAQGKYLPYFAAGWGVLLSLAVIVGWLMFAGATFAGSVVIVLVGSALYLIVARIVAETGLVFVQVIVPIQRPWTYLMSDLPGGLTVRTSVRSYFYAAMMNVIFVHDQRESLAGFAPNAFRVADGAAYPEESNWRRAIPFTFALLFALGVAFVVSGASMLYTEYSYSATLDERQIAINGYATETAPKNHVLTPTSDYDRGRTSKEVHSRWTQFGIGASLSTALSALRLRFVNWPLHPVGYLLCTSYPMRRIWFSIFIGWIAKTIIVWLGGSKLFTAVKPLFTGLILGEASAAAFWLLVCLVRNALGLSYRAVTILPL
jgi:hypothetical protein